MIDAFLAFFLVSLLPIAFLGIGGHTEHVLFIGWRWLQVVALFASSLFVVYQLARRDRRGLAVLALVVVGVAYLGLSYLGIAWDAQIEYNRVLQLAQRFGSITEAYRHGVTHWIFGYPPGASLSVAFFLTLKMISPNVAQGVLLALWSGSLLTRHLRHVDVPTKIVFFVLLATGTQLMWHFAYFYNNLFYALVWATFVFAPMFGSSLRPWEWCGYALVLVWLRPQWQIAAIPIGVGALAALASARTWNLRVLRDTILMMTAALAVAWLGSTYWRSASAKLDEAMSRENADVIANITAQQASPVLEIDVHTRPLAQQTTTVPPFLSRESVDAVVWAYHVTAHAYSLSLVVLAAVATLALLILRRRGLVFVVPLLSPIGIVLGTAAFAHYYAAYRANSWALERLQIITPILAAGSVAALHWTVRQRTRA